MLQTKSKYTKDLWLCLFTVIMLGILLALFPPLAEEEKLDKPFPECLEWSTIETGEWRDVRYGRTIRKEQVIHQYCLKYKE